VTSTDTTEFSFLREQADELGIDAATPVVQRVQITLPDGRTLSALRYGETAPEVTFLHGAGLNAHTWDTTIVALGRPALSVDLAGHGDSSWREDAAYTPRALAEDVIVALRQLTDRPQVLVGQSLGGLTAAAVAATAPPLISDVVIVDITPGIDPTAGPAHLRAFYEQTEFSSRDEMVNRAIAFGFGGSRRATERGVFLNSRVRPDGVVEWKHHFAKLASVLAAAPAADSRAVLSATGWDDLAAVVAPIVLVRGEQGFVSQDAAAEFANRLPAATVIDVPSGHNVQETWPSGLADLIRETLSPGDAAAAGIART